MATCKPDKDNKVSWYALVGFDKSDKDKTGYLALNKDKSDWREDSYKIVHDLKQALKFPSSNISSVSGFGTPKQWYEFFKEEDELSGWKFHLVKVKPN